MRLIRGRNLTIIRQPEDGGENWREFIKEIINYCTIPNPLYFQLLRMGKAKALYGCTKEYKYYRLDRQFGRGEQSEYPNLIVFRGLEPWLKNQAGRRGIQVEFIDQTVRPCGELASPRGTGIKFRDYQEGIVERVVERENGIIKLGTGFGKTIIALKITELLKTRTLVIVPRTDLLEQFKNEIKKYYGFEPGRYLEGGQIEVETIQTLQRKEKLEYDRYGCVIVDECHLSVPAKSRKVIQSFAPRYLYGMTATPRRTDGQGKVMQLLYGEILVDKEMERRNPTVYQVPFEEEIPVWEYADMIKSQIQFKKRNDLIISKIKDEIREGRKILVLTKRVEHWELLKNALNIKEAYGVSGKNKGSDRRDLYDSLRNGKEFSVLFGTFSLLSTGFDLPVLDTLVIAGDLKSDILAQQSSGRVLRLFEGKKEPKIIDIVDIKNPILKKQAKLRDKFYGDSGWIVTSIYGSSLFHKTRSSDNFFSSR